MKKIAVVAMGVALLGGEVSAGEGRVVPLTWKAAGPHRKGETAWVADVPRAQIVFAKEADGTRYLRLEYADGITCTTAASSRETDQNISFSCGTRHSYYWMGQVAGEMPVVEWVGSAAVGDKGS